MYTKGGCSGTTGYRPENARSRDAREDANLLKMALAQMWPIDAERKEDIIQRQMDIVNDPLVPSVVRVMAAKNIIACGIANVKVLELCMKVGVQGETIDVPMIATDSDIEQGLAQMVKNAEREEEQPVEERPVAINFRTA